MSNPKSVADFIESVKPISPVVFSPSRYPYTYAYDFMLEHSQYLPLTVQTSVRVGLCAGAANALKDWCNRTGEDHEQALTALADAYLALHCITKPSETSL